MVPRQSCRAFQAVRVWGINVMKTFEQWMAEVNDAIESICGMISMKPATAARKAIRNVND